MSPQFSRSKDTDLLAVIEHSLAAVPPDIETATIAYDELNRRNRGRAARVIFARTGIEPIPWLDAATKCLVFLEPPPPGRYQGHLYVILIGGFTVQNQFYGAYVGSSHYLPEARFLQHKAGYHSSGVVKRRGIQVLKSLCWPVGQTVPGGKKRVQWESALSRCLALVVPKVRGHCVPMTEWEDTFQPQLRAVYQLRDEILK